MSAQLNIIRREAPQYRGQWRPIVYRPDPFSPQNFVIGCVVEWRGRLQAFRLLSDTSKLECVYGKDLDAAGTLEFLGRIDTALRESVDRSTPNIGQLSPQIELGDWRMGKADSPAELADSLYQTIVALEPSDDQPGKPKRFTPRTEDRVRYDVNRHLYKRLQLRFEQIIDTRGYVEDQKQAPGHRIPINICGQGLVGSVISGWYAKAETVDMHALRARDGIETAHQLFGHRHRGLFILRPISKDNTKGLNKATLEQIDKVIDEIDWTLRSRRYAAFHVEEDEAELAERIAEFAER